MYALICFVLGLLLTCIVALGCIRLAPTSQQLAFQAVEPTSPHAVLLADEGRFEQFYYQHSEGFGWTYDTYYATRGGSLSPYKGELHVTQTGWPLRCFTGTSGEVKGMPRDQTLWTRWDNPLRGRLDAVPYGPKWGPLLLNTFLYGGVVFALMQIRPARRTLRRWRNRCPNCGYSRKGQVDDHSPCPECGTKL